MFYVLKLEKANKIKYRASLAHDNNNYMYVTLLVTVFQSSS